jgi:hypothetical protein
MNLFDELINTILSIIAKVRRANSLSVDFLFGSQHKDIIDQWISSAIADGAERIELLFSNNAYGMPHLNLYRFPHTLLSEVINHLLPHAEFLDSSNLRLLC